jgi:hypothetical protein
MWWLMTHWPPSSLTTPTILHIFNNNIFMYFDPLNGSLWICGLCFFFFFEIIQIIVVCCICIIMTWIVHGANRGMELYILYTVFNIHVCMYFFFYLAVLRWALVEVLALTLLGLLEELDAVIGLTGVLLKVRLAPFLHVSETIPWLFLTRKFADLGATEIIN